MPIIMIGLKARRKTNMVVSQARINNPPAKYNHSFSVPGDYE